MTIAIIVAQATNRVIGHGNRIPWKVKGEQKLFKSITMGGTLIMGRKTYDSIGRPLLGRKTIVVSRDTDLKITGCEVCSSLDAGLACAALINAPIFIAGGGELYLQAIDQVDEIHLTTISLEADGDVFFPEVPPDFKIVHEQHYCSNFDYTYRLLRRV